MGTIKSGGRATLTALLTVTLLALTPAAAWAHGDEGTNRAYVYVRQAIALIVNTPGGMDSITDKVGDALDASDPSQVQLSYVRQAKAALSSGDMMRVRTLLEQSVGARVHTSNVDPVPIGQPAPMAADTGTVTPTDPLAGRAGGLTAGDSIMLILAVVVGLGGIALSIRLRPRLVPHPKPVR